MTLVACIATSRETHEQGLELAARVVEAEQIEVGTDNRAADRGAAVLGGRQRERLAARLRERLGDLCDAVDSLQQRGHLRDAVVGDAHRDRDLPDLALLAGELALRP